MRIQVPDSGVEEEGTEADVSEGVELMEQKCLSACPRTRSLERDFWALESQKNVSCNFRTSVILL